MSTNGGFTIRPATTADLPAVQVIMLRTLAEDFQTAYDPSVHRDIDDLNGTYLEPPRHALFVAVDDATGQVIGTGGIREGWLRGGPRRLVERYRSGDTAQLVRIYVRREDRRRGIARALVRANLAFALDDGGYVIIALHTFPHSPGALPFWESIARRVGAQERSDIPPEVFFEIDLDDARRMVAGQPPGSGPD